MKRQKTRVDTYGKLTEQEDEQRLTRVQAEIAQLDAEIPFVRARIHALTLAMRNTEYERQRDETLWGILQLFNQELQLNAEQEDWWELLEQIDLPLPGLPEDDDP